MSQQTVLELLQELGGIATVSEIIKLAREDIPIFHYRIMYVIDFGN
jgi:hypothetical protein